MGWASAGKIFDPVAQALIDADVATDVKRRVLGTLIDKLRDGDWDTPSESLEAFSRDLDIVVLFYERGLGNDLYGRETDGRVSFDVRRGVWVLSCDDCGPLDEATFDVAGHNRLIELWAVHDQNTHGGDGDVLDHRLIGGR